MSRVRWVSYGGAPISESLVHEIKQAFPAARVGNGFGLTDLSGVVHEWCLDWHADGFYAVSPERNPPGPPTGSRRVSRGGAWRHPDPWSPVAHRSSLPPHLRYSDYGFRVVRAG